MSKPPKLKQVHIKGTGDLLKLVSNAHDALGAVRELVHTVIDDANAQVEDHRKLMQRHLDRKDLRPHVKFKPLPKNNWAVAFNSVTYSLGPYDDFADLDEDDPRFFWMGPDGVKHPARSMFQALLAVVQDFCNAPPPQGDDN